MADVITSGKVIQKPDIVLETDEFLPPGILDVRNKTRDESGLLSGAGSDSTFIGEDTEPTDPDGTGTPSLPPEDLYVDAPGSMPVPQDMKIISQTVKVGDDKKITVDVVIETSDFPGIREFEARVTKSQL